LWILLDTVVTTAATMGASIAVARILGPARLGYYHYLTWIAAMAKLVAEMGVPLATRKFAAELRGRGDYAQLRALVDATGRFQSAVAVIMTALGLGFVFSVVPREHWPYAILTAVALGPGLLIGVPSAILWSTENLGPNTKSSLLATAVNLSGVVLSLVMGWDLTGLAGSLLASRMVDLLIRRRLAARAYAQMPPATGALPPDLRARLLRFCWAQSVLLGLDVIIWNRSELLFLERFSDIRQVAFFSQAFNLIQQLLMLPMALSSSAGITIMVRQGQAPKTVGRLSGTALWFVALFAVPSTLGVAALAGPVVRILYGQQYLEAIPVLAICGFFGAARALSYPILELLFATEHQSFVVRWSFVMVPINVGLAMWLVPDGGALAAAWVKGITHFITVAGLWVYAARRAGLAAPVGRVVKLFAISTLMMLAVRALAETLPSIVGLAAGVPAGVLLMVVLLRFARCADPADGERLASLQRLLPGPMRRLYLLLVRFVHPTAAASATNG
jgi:O-antigen/teichoic acid export membrane protein